MRGTRLHQTLLLVSALTATAGSVAGQVSQPDFEKCAGHLRDAGEEFLDRHLGALTACEAKRLAEGRPTDCASDPKVAQARADAATKLRQRLKKCKAAALTALCPFRAKDVETIARAIVAGAGSTGARLDAFSDGVFIDDFGPGCERPAAHVSREAADCAVRLDQGARQISEDLAKCLFDCELGRIERSGGDFCIDDTSGEPIKPKLVSCYENAVRSLRGLLTTKCDPTRLAEIGCPLGARSSVDTSLALFGVAADLTESLNLGLFHSPCRTSPRPSTPPPPPTARATREPSGVPVQVACGQVIDRAFMRGDTAIALHEDLNCESVDAPTDGLVIGVSGLTLDGGRDARITGPARSSNRSGTGVRILPGIEDVRIHRLKQIQRFGYGIADSGDNRGLVVTDVSLFRNTIAGIRLLSPKARIERVTADRNRVGFELGGDGAEIRESTARRSTPAPGIGAYLFGADTDGDDRAARMRESRVEENMVGVVLEGGPHHLGETSIVGSLGDGVRVEASGARVESNSIKGNGGEGVLVAGSGSLVRKNRIEENGGAGIAVTGTANLVKNNTAGSPNGRGNHGHGFVVVGADNRIENNKAEGNLGSGLVIRATTSTLKSNRAVLNEGFGLEVASAGNLLDSNVASRSGGFEFVIAPGNLDRPRTNRANGSTFVFGAEGGTFE
jgi:Right handed beta helix region